MSDHDQVPLVVALAGDVMLGRHVNESLRVWGYAHPWGDMLAETRRSHAFLVNLECALTSHTECWRDGEKAFYFRADPGVTRTLQIGGVDAVSLANNHAGDFGTEGLLQTLAELDRARIAHAGAGASLADARRPAITWAAGFRIALVAFADHPAAWAAGPSHPGINYTEVSTQPRHFAKIEDSLALARRMADLVIFGIHWGPNMVSRPGPGFQDFARAVIDAGADVFWGHSAHVVHGIEVWNGKPILYDTGDFIDDYAVEPYLRNDLSALFRVHARPPFIEFVEVIPVTIRDMQVNAARGSEREWFCARFQERCAEMGTDVEMADTRLMVHIPARSRTGKAG